MDTVGIEDAGRLARVVSGDVDSGRLTLFSTMKNEMGFLPAWLAHHRAIGFEQFLIWDDSSDDGSFEYLSAQADVVVMHSDLSFGALLRYRDPDGVEREERAGTYFKIALPHLFFDGVFVGYVDADEFLILPPGVVSIGEVVARLADEGAPSAVASVVEFFPASASGLEGALPQGFADLMAAYPYFQCERLVDLQVGAQPALMGKSKTARLFNAFDVKPKVIRRGWQRVWMSSKDKKAQEFQKSPRHKTPLVRRDAQSRLTGSHYGNLPPSSEVLLTVAHFVFTAQFADKIARATEWGAHANAAAKYRYYAELLDKMRGVEHGFLDENSVAYEGAQQLIDCGLMRW
ncbi:glycosyltransferase family 2 protein [Antarctobacter heliothermus]|uniref:Glycosyl transferase family 2 n=1 Tax=Antarctobacter heliothermus TaxID=74033 RepID=A0A239FI80_9RHOB|nr:glycosyltransferase family 2 protein [Antarctobacter heliothermus]SNS56619.1 Glycosyl transferase family 2 [Antarctobacter heliothermus]